MARDLRTAFRDRLESPDDLSETRTFAKSGELDHPDFADLPLGGEQKGEAAILFLDIRGFTRLSMGFSPKETARVVNAVVGTAIEGLRGYGAHINDFPGDGVMAVFGGDGSAPSALHATSGLMTQFSAVLRDELLQVGFPEPVQVAMGLVSGEVLWKRIGTDEVSRVMAIGEVAPLAAKYVTGDEANAWQTVIGGRVADAVPARFKEQLPAFTRTFKGQKLARKRWLFDTEGFNSSASDLSAVQKLTLSVGSVDFGASTGGLDRPKRDRGLGSRPERTTG